MASLSGKVPSALHFAANIIALVDPYGRDNLQRTWSMSASNHRNDDQHNEGWDCIIVGGGPAGLAAALLLGRARRRILLLDSGEYRNARAHKLHGFPTRDGCPPAHLRNTALSELKAYPSITIQQGRALEARQDNDGFVVTALMHDVPGQQTLGCRKLLLATGLEDEVPDIPGLDAIYGLDAWHCPYCDGYERRDQPLAVYGHPKKGLAMALEASGWSENVIYCTGGYPLELPERERLAGLGIEFYESPVHTFVVEDGRLKGIRFDNGVFIARSAILLAIRYRQRSELAQQLGCSLTAAGLVQAEPSGETSIEGLYVAGDAASTLHLALVAAAQGSRAAFEINTALLRQDLEQRRQAQPNVPSTIRRAAGE
jgi:thioredoxin reductase